MEVDSNDGCFDYISFDRRWGLGLWSLDGGTPPTLQPNTSCTWFLQRVENEFLYKYIYMCVRVLLLHSPFSCFL